MGGNVSRHYVSLDSHPLNIVGKVGARMAWRRGNSPIPIYQCNLMIVAFVYPFESWCGYRDYRVPGAGASRPVTPKLCLACHQATLVLLQRPRWWLEAVFAWSCASAKGLQSVPQEPYGTPWRRVGPFIFEWIWSSLCGVREIKCVPTVFRFVTNATGNRRLFHDKKSELHLMRAAAGWGLFTPFEQQIKIVTLTSASHSSVHFRLKFQLDFHPHLVKTKYLPHTFWIKKGPLWIISCCFEEFIFALYSPYSLLSGYNFVTTTTWFACANNSRVQNEQNRYLFAGKSPSTVWFIDFSIN